MSKATDEELIQKFLATEGIPVNPELPDNWDDTPNEDRPDCHWLLKGKPYIVTFNAKQTRYSVRMLDGECWDRSTNFGSFQTLTFAILRAESLSL